MQLSVIHRVQRKELTLFFTSAIGYLFLSAFLGAAFFLFFWQEAFFARNIADVTPLFEQLPVLLIFLCAALTMRMWSEERRAGTLEFVATLPATTWEFVLGKFVACWVLLAIALVLTLGLPITVSLLGDLDWGPVWAGYLAALLLGGTYICVGLFVSSRTDSQIVSLLMTTLICGALYMVGSKGVTQFFTTAVQQVMFSLGTGSRFESITRGVIDFRDLYYYISLGGLFLVANVYVLERERWSEEGNAQRHNRVRLASALLVLNLVAANFVLQPVNALRLDVTQGNIYSISPATQAYLQQLREPLLIRGYFSAKTHPDLAPLVPRLQNLLQEYEVAGDGRVRVELVDPVLNPELENEANAKYGIRAMPFQVADRRQASLVNSYFDVLIQYGDEYEVLSFRDFIEVKARSEGDFEIQLKNPEFDITRSIKKVLYGFQGGTSVFDSISEPVEFIGYISSDGVLPEALLELNVLLEQVLSELQEQADGKLSTQVVDPQAGDGQVAIEIANDLGIAPMSLGLFDETGFYYNLILRQGEAVVQVDVPDSLSADALKKNFEESLKRFASGLLKRVVLALPEPTPAYLQQRGTPVANEFSQLRSLLGDNFEVVVDDLSSGVVPAGGDLLMVMDPSGFSDKQVFAIDQFLMKGGTVVVSSGAFAAQASQAGLSAVPRESGLGTWLDHHGVTIGKSLIMDPQNSAFPVPVTREAGGFTFQDLMMLDYPYFADIRGDGLSDVLPITAGLPQLTVSWPSPITTAERDGVQNTTILSTSQGSWLSTDTNVMPQFDDQGVSMFQPTGETGSHMVAVALEGKFTSNFAGLSSPLAAPDEAVPEPVPQDGASNDVADDSGEDGEDLSQTVAGVIDRSPESARLLVFASNDFAADQTLRMVGAADGVINTNAVQLLTNVVDWSLEDQNLIGIRSRGNFTRTLPAMDESVQARIETINYGLGIAGVVLVLVLFRLHQRRKLALQKTWLQAQLGESL